MLNLKARLAACKELYSIESIGRRHTASVKALAVDSSLTEAHNTLGSVFLRKQDSHYNLGLAQRALGDRESARQELGTALAIDSQFAAARSEWPRPFAATDLIQAYYAPGLHRLDGPILHRMMSERSACNESHSPYIDCGLASDCGIFRDSGPGRGGIATCRIPLNLRAHS